MSANGSTIDWITNLVTGSSKKTFYAQLLKLTTQNDIERNESIITALKPHEYNTFIKILEVTRSIAIASVIYKLLFDMYIQVGETPNAVFNNNTDAIRKFANDYIEFKCAIVKKSF